MIHCKIDDCGRQIAHKALGLCNMHYQRLRRTGSTADPIRVINLCAVPDCSKRVHADGICAMHWMRQHRHGDLDTRLRQRDTGPASERWLQKVRVESPGCWIWTAGTTGKSGYGAYEGITAHLWVWRHLVGPVPEGLELDHLCRQRLCCNPDHLEPVTHNENTRRGIVGMTIKNDADYRAKHAAYMREYMRNKRAEAKAAEST